MVKIDVCSFCIECGIIVLQDVLQDIWDKKYWFKSKDGMLVDVSVDGIW